MKATPSFNFIFVDENMKVFQWKLTHKMAYFNYLYVLVAFSFIISSGIHIFSRGFLLTRSAQTEKRFCDKFYITVDGSQCLSDDKVIYDAVNVITTR